jgi:hypothetical protein
LALYSIYTETASRCQQQSQYICRNIFANIEYRNFWTCEYGALAKYNTAPVSGDNFFHEAGVDATHAAQQHDPTALQHEINVLSASVADCQNTIDMRHLGIVRANAGIVNAAGLGRVLTGSVWKVRTMTRNWSSRSDRLASAARAAGYAMATPDDRPDDLPAEAPVQAPAVKSSWTPASPQRALIVAPARPTSMQATFRDWMAALTWRAPA